MTVVNHNYSQRSEPEGGFKSLAAFYPFYLGEHCNVTNRRLHLMGKVQWVGWQVAGSASWLYIRVDAGTTLSLAITLLAAIKRKPQLLLAALIQGYAFAWIGHFVFEKK